MTFVLRSKYVVPVDGPVLENAFVRVREGRIVEVGRVRSAEAWEDLGDAVLLPGFVNAHTHLEFSELQRPLGIPGMDFPDWIRAVISWRNADPSAGNGRRAIATGLAECLRHGVTLVGDILTQPGALADDLAVPVHGYSFRELLGLAPERTPQHLEAARRHLSERCPQRWRTGISPHAPYTINPQCVAQLAQLSARSQCPVAMHLAESPQELELLRDHQGSLVELLSELGAWFPAAIPRGTVPADYLRALAPAHRTLVIHGNYLTPTEIQAVADFRDRMAIVFCPRTHAFFGHAPYPLREMQQAGVTVALGTDSRASNPNLSVWEEIREVVCRYQVSPETALRMGTLNGATALGNATAHGSLTPGKVADLVAIRSPGPSRDPYDVLLDPAAEIVRGTS